MGLKLSIYNLNPNIESPAPLNLDRTLAIVVASILSQIARIVDRHLDNITTTPKLKVTKSLASWFHGVTK